MGTVEAGSGGTGVISRARAPSSGESGGPGAPERAGDTRAQLPGCQQKNHFFNDRRQLRRTNNTQKILGTRKFITLR